MAFAALALPGDRFRIASTSSVKLGPGLAVYPSTRHVAANEDTVDSVDLIAIAPGIVGEVQPSSSDVKKRAASATSLSFSKALWVESNTNRRYVPMLHDHVICQITNRGVEAYTVTLLTSYTPANVPALAFEGATKRNKPNLRVGTLLYAHVASAHRHLEVELTCVDPTTGKSNGFGELKTMDERDSTTAANVWPVSCGLARSLLDAQHTLLTRLAAHFPFEVAIGVNGFVWVRARNARHVIAVGKVLESADREAATAAARDNTDDSSAALQAAKQRGALSSDAIAKIVQPFK